MVANKIYYNMSHESMYIVIDGYSFSVRNASNLGMMLERIDAVVQYSDVRHYIEFIMSRLFN
jgi:hypothetical protein